MRAIDDFTTNHIREGRGERSEERREMVQSSDLGFGDGDGFTSFRFCRVYRNANTIPALCSRFVFYRMPNYLQ